MTLKIGIVAGEASGDLIGAGLIQALRQLHPQIQLSGVGGPAMIKAGFDSLFAQEELAVMGIIEPLRRLPRLIHIRRELYRHFSQNKPDIFIGIDSPDFNLGLELQLRRQGIRTAHYVSPSVWAWRQKRIFKIARAVDLMLTLFPFEAEFYKKHQVPVKFVGHPLADKIALQVDKGAVRKALGLEEQRPVSAAVPAKAGCPPVVWANKAQEDGVRRAIAQTTGGQPALAGTAAVIALLPGSRRQELQQLGKSFLEAALLCHQAKPELRFITSSINQERDEQWRSLHQEFAPGLPLDFFVGRSREVMAAADAILVTSGTATLEAMLFKRPMVIAYRTSTFNYFLARFLIKTPFIGLPNLLAQEKLVPELIQDAVQPQVIAPLLLEYLDRPEKTQALQEKFTRLHQQLSQNADHQAAKAVLELLST